MSIPTQAAPPKAGAGLLQNLSMVLVPWPQVEEQVWSRARQWDQPPSMGPAGIGGRESSAVIDGVVVCCTCGCGCGVAVGSCAAVTATRSCGCRIVGDRIPGIGYAAGIPRVHEISLIGAQNWLKCHQSDQGQGLSEIHSSTRGAGFEAVWKSGKDWQSTIYNQRNIFLQMTRNYEPDYGPEKGLITRRKTLQYIACDK